MSDLDITSITSDMMEALNQDDDQIQLEAIQKLRAFFSKKPNLPFEQVIQTGIVQRFVQFLMNDHDHQHPLLQVESAWTLGDIIRDNSGHISVIIEAGAVPILIRLLASSNENLLSAALSVVDKIVAEDDDSSTQAVIDANALPHLLTLLTHPNESIVKTVGRTLSNITAGTPDQIQSVMNANIMPPLVQMMADHPDLDVRREAAWTILNAITGGTEKQMIDIVEADDDNNVIPLICELLIYKNRADYHIVMAALNAIDGILRVGARIAESQNKTKNFYAILIENSGGLDKMDILAREQQREIYEKADDIIEKYFD